ncbi:MAG: sulfatase-like hydrolase/transferase, partial [Planctomycetaceae bacterium]|nr:sulfatase-like hydrolase/transferase [Planctomycetaceae bacterium]
MEISNEDTNGYVIADAVQLLPAKKKTVQKADPNAPNIVLLFADDLGYEALGCYGGKEFSTPNLDRLASQGMRFRRAYTSPVCTPSRMSLYTGRYTSRHGYYNVLPVHVGTKQAVDFRQRFATFPQVLRDAGYATSVTGKWQLAALEFHPDHCRDAGFDSWCVWQIWRNGAKTTRYWNPCLNHDGRLRDDIGDRFGPDVLADYVISQMQTAVKENCPFYIHHNMLLPHWPILETPNEKASGEKPSLDRMITYLDGLVGRIVGAVDELG